MADVQNFEITELVAGAGCVAVHFNMKEVTRVNVYRRAEGDNDWSYVATDTHSPYIDYWPVKHLGNLEDREYKVCPVVEGKEGPESEIATILFAG